MRKILIFSTLLFVVYSASAQVNFGPRISLTSTKLKLKDNVTGISEGDAEFGYQFGVFARLKLLGLYVQPELLFSDTKSTITRTAASDVKFSFNKVDVPIMVGMKFGPMRVQAGPALSFLTKAESDIVGTVADVKDNYNSATVGFQAGLGIDLMKFVFDIKYEGNLSKFAGSEIISGININTDQRQNQFVFALGYKLF